MMSALFNLLGGIGLFLLGMILLTDGLKAFAGDALRSALLRFTGTPAKAFTSGALVTLLVQSSTATTVTLIGFVSAGMLTFPQALGVVFGASLGTTGTGWLVAILGLHVNLGFYALPVVGIGALLKLLGNHRGASLGLAVAGFGLIFIGIHTLQEGMASVSGIFNLAALPSTGLAAHLLVMLIGAVLTLILQSSTAAAATTLTALHSGAINFEQAAALVIGAAIGTTATGALAALGGSVPAKRTATAHVLFNLTTGLFAVLLLPALLWLIRQAQLHLGLEAGAVSLAAFHTVFIGLGVACFLPLVHQYGRLIEWLLPDKGPSLTRHLDTTLLNVPGVALSAAYSALHDCTREMLACLQAVLGQHPAEQDTARRRDIHQAVAALRAFVTRIPLEDRAPLLAPLHVLDHMSRLDTRLNPPATLRRHLQAERLQEAVAHTRRVLELARQGLEGSAPEDWQDIMARHAQALDALRRQERETALRLDTTTPWTPLEALEAMDALRWLERVGYHSWRLCHHLNLQASADTGNPAEDTHDAPLTEED